MSSTDLNTSIPGLQRIVATPGTFATVFPNTASADLLGLLEDAFAETQMDGYFTANAPPVVGVNGATVQSSGWSLDLTSGVITPSVPLGGQALIIIYAGIRMIQAEMFNRTNIVKYSAKGVDYETQQSSNMLTTLLNDLTARKQDILTRYRLLGASLAFSMADQYFIRAIGYYPGANDFFGPDIDRAYDSNGPYPYGF